MHTLHHVGCLVLAHGLERLFLHLLLHLRGNAEDIDARSGGQNLMLSSGNCSETGFSRRLGFCAMFYLLAGDECNNASEDGEEDGSVGRHDVDS